RVVAEGPGDGGEVLARNVDRELTAVEQHTGAAEFLGQQFQGPAVDGVRRVVERRLGAARHAEAAGEAAVAGGVAGTAGPHARLAGEDGLLGGEARGGGKVLLRSLVVAHRMRPFISTFA